MDENGWETLQSVQRFIFNISKEAPSQGEQLITDICNDKYKCSLNLIIFQMIYTCFLSSGNKFDLHINFLNKLNLIEGNKEENILKNFIHFLLRKYKQKSNYLIEYIINEKLIESKTIKNMKTLYFAHHFSKEEFNKDILPYCKDENIDELSKNDWELHKKLIKEGHSPNEIAKIIRNDEIEKLQEISSQSNFDFNQTIKPSLYERYSFINQKSVTLIDYAAFFSAEKCFKYLLMNGANAINTGKYAIAGGNLEIIHLCEQNHSSFEDACETAIKYHRNNIFQYIYESKMENLNNIELGKKCIIYHNYEIFTFCKKKV